MTASEHLQPLQLQMFMPAGKVKALDKPLDAQGQDPEPMWRGKLREASRPGTANDAWGYGAGPSMVDSIRQSGVREPVNLFHNPDRPPYLTQGHHRVAVADYVDPTMEIPIRHVGASSVTQRKWAMNSRGQWEAHPLTSQ